MRSPWKNKVIRAFDEQAKIYSAHNTLQETIATELSAHLPALSASPKILEIGCGTGTFTRHLLDKYPKGEFLITDIAPEMLKHTQEHVIAREANICWDLLDGEHLESLGEKRFDLIVSNMAAQWFEAPKSALNALTHFLKPGGALYYSAPGPGSFKEWHSTLKNCGLESGVLEFKALPGIFEEKEMTVNYGSALEFLRSLKRIGAHTPRENYPPLRVPELRRACRNFDEEFSGASSWNIIYGKI